MLEMTGKDLVEPAAFDSSPLPLEELRFLQVCPVDLRPGVGTGSCSIQRPGLAC